MISCPAFFAQYDTAGVCCTCLLASSAQPLESAPVLSVTNAAVMIMVNVTYLVSSVQVMVLVVALSQ